ncbi:MAG: VOC family protein [Methylacidiphilaceae bacterium]|nr:VOC family protein [Candidatus Methylacidiphilaceae bacterium]
MSGKTMLLPPKIKPHLWFDKEAREAAEFYVSIFPDSRLIEVAMVPDTPSGDVEVVLFELSGVPFSAFSAGPRFRFNESISFWVSCATQEEIDYYWASLSAHPDSEACGWLKDRYGLSWQIVPAAMEEMMKRKEPARLARLTQAMLGMKKLDVAALRKAFDGTG